MAFSGKTIAVVFGIRKGKDPRVVALFLDSQTGKIAAKQSWVGYADERTAIFPTAGGNFILLTGGQEDVSPPILYLLSSIGQELKTIRLPARYDRKGDYWQLLDSSSGRSALLIHGEDGFDELALLDTETLNSRSDWRLNSPESVKAISDQQMLSYGPDGVQLVRGFGDSSVHTLPLLNSQFVNGESILMLSPNPPGQATIITTTGEQLSSFQVAVNDPGPHNVRPVVYTPFVAADGRRFGMVVDDIGGRKFLQAYQRTLYIWQDMGKDLVFTLPLKYWIIYGPDVSLSADGSVLAVVNAQEVSAYSLPQFGNP